MSHHADSGHAAHGHLGHIVPLKTFVIVFVSLLILTVITVAISRFDFGMMNIVVAMFVASIKATIVALFFMHLKFEDKLTWGFAVLPLFLLVLLIGGVFIDNPLRTKVEPLQPASFLLATEAGAEAPH